MPGGASPTDASSIGPPSQWWVSAARRIGWPTSRGSSTSSHSRCLSRKRSWKRADTVIARTCRSPWRRRDRRARGNRKGDRCRPRRGRPATARARPRLPCRSKSMLRRRAQATPSARPRRWALPDRRTQRAGRRAGSARGPPHARRRRPAAHRGHGDPAARRQPVRGEGARRLPHHQRLRQGGGAVPARRARDDREPAAAHLDALGRARLGGRPEPPARRPTPRPRSTATRST